MTQRIEKIVEIVNQAGYRFKPDSYTKTYMVALLMDTEDTFLLTYSSKKEVTQFTIYPDDKVKVITVSDRRKGLTKIETDLDNLVRKLEQYK